MSRERALDLHLSRERCPFCHDAVRPEHDKAACDGCMAWQHAECWRAHGACAACGAGPGGAPAPPPARVAPPAAAKQAPGASRAGPRRPDPRPDRRPDRRDANVFLGVGLANLVLFLGLHGLVGGGDGIMLLLALLFGAPATLFGAYRRVVAWRAERLRDPA